MVLSCSCLAGVVVGIVVDVLVSFPFNWITFQTRSCVMGFFHFSILCVFVHFRLEGIEKAERNVLPLLSLAKLL